MHLLTISIFGHAVLSFCSVYVLDKLCSGLKWHHYQRWFLWVSFTTGFILLGLWIMPNIQLGCMVSLDCKLIKNYIVQTFIMCSCRSVSPIVSEVLVSDFSVSSEALFLQMSLQMLNLFHFKCWIFSFYLLMVCNQSVLALVVLFITADVQQVKICLVYNIGFRWYHKYMLQVLFLLET